MNTFQILDTVLKKIENKSPAAGRIFLNFILPKIIPFNRAHHFSILKLSNGESEVEIPFRRSNKNHLGGLHAGALATVGEYAAGILILRRMDFSKQRLVLKELRCDYKKQGRGNAVARAKWPSDFVLQSVEEFRNSPDVLEVPICTIIKNTDGIELAHVYTTWQVKPWSKVRKA